MAPSRSILPRRAVLLAAPALVAGCGPRLPPLPAEASTAAGEALLAASAAAHGARAFAAVHDVSVRYAGRWRPLIGAVQPALVDAGYRGGSEERLLPQAGLYAQAFTGPRGHKQVVRHDAGADGTVRVWYDGIDTNDADTRDAAAMVADLYALFLFGPMLLAGRWRQIRRAILSVGAPETIPTADGPRPCDTLQVSLRPGTGFSDRDDLLLFIDRQSRLMRRVRFTLNGLDSTQGAVAEVDCGEHRGFGGIVWPTRFHEQLLRPADLPVHDWRLEALALDRAIRPIDLEGPALRGAAATPAG